MRGVSGCSAFARLAGVGVEGQLEFAADVLVFGGIGGKAEVGGALEVAGAQGDVREEMANVGARVLVARVGEGAVPLAQRVVEVGDFRA